MRSELPAEWVAGCSAEVLDIARRAYDSPGRFYHTWSHILACIDTLRTIPCDEARIVFLALVFHDAIYVPGRPDNEERSAELARDTLRCRSDLQEAAIQRIHRMILATRSHAIAESDPSRDLRVVVDIDMSILGSEESVYERYAEDVRSEYCPAVTTEAKFTTGRILFLEKVLAEPHIYHLPDTIERWEAAARRNVARELSRLRKSQGPLWRAVTKVLAWRER
jgi:predicted metal-dependent HD superfamily phosphohydrolase